MDDRLAFVEKAIRHCLDKGFSYERTKILIEGLEQRMRGAVSMEEIELVLRKLYGKGKAPEPSLEAAKEDTGLPERIREVLRNASLIDAGNAECFRAV